MEEKTIQTSEENGNLLWDIKRKFKLQSLDEAITLLKEKSKIDVVLHGKSNHTMRKEEIEREVRENG